MAKAKQLNTGVKITDKGGNTYVYDSIEKASEMTTLSVQTLKIRANKNSIPKGKYLELDLYWSLVHSYSNTKEL